MAEKKEINIHNLKSKQYREVFADGASLGITPSGYFHLNFFAQRNSIPKGMVFEVTEEGDIGQLKSLLPNSKSGIVRQHEIGLYLDIKTCESLRDLLEQKIDEYRKFLQNK